MTPGLIEVVEWCDGNLLEDDLLYIEDRTRGLIGVRPHATEAPVVWARSLEPAMFGDRVRVMILAADEIPPVDCDDDDDD